MPQPDRDRIIAARIAGVARRHCRGASMTGEQEHAALAALAEVAEGRVDLLAETAGLAIGCHEDELDPVQRQVAQLCITAGADSSLIEQWIEVGRSRVAHRGRIPYTGRSDSMPGGGTS